MHRFVSIPSRHCLNLATAVSIVLFDRAAELDVELDPASEPEIDDLEGIDGPLSEAIG